MTHLTHLRSFIAEDEDERRGLCNMIARTRQGSTIDGGTGVFFLLRLWRQAAGPGDSEREALENWVRLRFQLAASDPMIAIIGAMGRLTDAGMTADDATETVLRILHEEVADGSATP